MFDEIDADIDRLSSFQLKQRLMRHRREARQGMETLAAVGNDNCWDDLVRCCENLLPSAERRFFKRGNFNMTVAQILGHCLIWVLDQAKRGNARLENAD